MGLLAWLGLALAACPAAAPPPVSPVEPDLAAQEPVRCEQGSEETDPTCTPEGCLSPPEPEEGSGGAGAQEEMDCSAWED